MLLDPISVIYAATSPALQVKNGASHAIVNPLIPCCSLINWLIYFQHSRIALSCPLNLVIVLSLNT